jgi:DNA-binding MarR family transcriptional regulator
VTAAAGGYLAGRPVPGEPAGLASLATMERTDGLAELASKLREATGQVIRRVRYESGNSLTWSQSVLLSDLARRGEATASELAAEQGLRAQTVWASLETLERRGLVSRERDANDRRHVRARLTDVGRAELVADREARDAWIVGVLAEEFTPDELSALATALPLMVKLANAGDAAG